MSSNALKDTNAKEGVKPMIHALWLVPAAMLGAVVGYAICALCVSARITDDEILLTFQKTHGYNDLSTK